jgi:ribosome biogenesis GTPase
MFSIADPSSMPKRVLEVKDLDTVDPVAVGDEVSYDVAEDGSGVIAAIQPRRNKLSRPATEGARHFKKSGPREQVIVANVDQIIVVMPAASPPPSWNLLDRYLATAEASDIPALICFTKADMMPADRAPTPDEPAVWEPPLLPEITLYRQIGYRVILTSAVSRLGIDEVKVALRDRVSVLWGKSGVGKTSLLNAVEPGLGLRVKAVNDHNREGRHTTAHLEMFDLSFGGSVIDTPGQRAFKIWDEIDDYAHCRRKCATISGAASSGSIARTRASRAVPSSRQ